MSAQPSINSPTITAVSQRLTRAERETIAVRELVKKKSFAPGIVGWDREQQALMIVRVVLDAIEGSA